MPMLMQRAQPVSEEQLHKFLEVMITKLLENKPSLANNPKMLDDLVQQTAQLLQYKFQDKQEDLTLANMRKPDFMKQLSLTILVIGELQENKDLSKQLDESITKLLKNDKFMEAFKKLLDPTNNKKDTKELTKELEKLLKDTLGSEKTTTLKEALKKFSDMFKSLKNDEKKFSKSNSPQPEPDPLIHLLGVLDSSQTGTIEVPVPVQLGNLIAAPDQHAGDGDAFIDRQNSIRPGETDGSLMAGKIQNYEQISSPLVEAIIEKLDQAGLNPNTPRLTR